jgi:hypothetical protein
MADLSALDFSETAEQGAKLVLRDPISNEVLTDDAGNEQFIIFRGKDSITYQKTVNKITNAKFEKANRTRRLIGTAEESLNEEIELLAQAAISWNVFIGGQKPECNVAEVRKLLTKLPPIREQAQAFVDNRANFLKS